MTGITKTEFYKIVWTRPRQSFERLFSEDTDPGLLHDFFPHFLLYGVFSGLDRASLRNMGDQITNLFAIIPIAAIGGIIGAFIGLYLFGWLIGFTNKWIGGTGEVEDIRAAMGWATYPFVIIGLLWIPCLFLFGIENFTAEMPRTDSSPFLLSSFFILYGAQVLAAIFAFVIWCKGVGVACNFSAWKALGASLMAVLIIAIPLIAIFAAIVTF